MVWMMSKANHSSSISSGTRNWLRSSFWDRALIVFTSPWAWACWILVGGVIAATGEETVSLGFLIPHGFWLLDGILDHFQTGGEIAKFMSRPDVVLATRAEYIGGHPRLPHGRFGYLMIRGDQQNPLLSINFPAMQGDGENFDVPLLDFEKSEPKTEREGSLAETILASIDERAGGMFGGERVTLNVDYRGSAGRKHRVELTSFFRGNDEIRNWRNYLICAQAEADTGITPHEPWKSLQPAPEEVTTHAPSGDGSKMQPARRAFDRR